MRANVIANGTADVLLQKLWGAILCGSRATVLDGRDALAVESSARHTFAGRSGGDWAPFPRNIVWSGLTMVLAV